MSDFEDFSIPKDKLFESIHHIQLIGGEFPHGFCVDYNRIHQLQLPNNGDKVRIPTFRYIFAIEDPSINTRRIAREKLHNQVLVQPTEHGLIPTRAKVSQVARLLSDLGTDNTAENNQRLTKNDQARIAEFKKKLPNVSILIVRGAFHSKAEFAAALNDAVYTRPAVVRIDPPKPDLKLVVTVDDLKHATKTLLEFASSSIIDASELGTRILPNGSSARPIIQSMSGAISRTIDSIAHRFEPK